MSRSRRRGALIALFVCLLAPFAVRAQFSYDVPFVPTPPVVVEEMLRLANVGPADFVIDLGSGDGRIVIEAAKKHGTTGLGVELDPNLVFTANQEAERQGVGGKASFVNGNLYNFDFSRASVLSMYLLPKINLDLRPRILNDLKPGTRVVSHDFDMGNWNPDFVREVPVPDKPYGAPVSRVYLWYVPANIAGTWRWQLTVDGRTRVYEARIKQFFQEFDCEVSVGGSVSTVQNAKLRGDSISFTLTREFPGPQVTHEFSGRIEGDKAIGRVRISGGENATLDWFATRSERGKMRVE